MIVIKIEMWPLGNEKKAYPLGRAYIWNTANWKLHKESKGKRGDYSFCIMRKDKVEIPSADIDETDTVAHGDIKNWPRLSYSVWKLVAKMLSQAFNK